MLVLTRKAGQSVVISGRVTLTVNRVNCNRVTLAFDAPPHVHIRRSELPMFDGPIDEELETPPAVSSYAPNELRD